MDFTKLKDRLIKNGYEVSVFSTGTEAAEYLNKEIDGTDVGFGGSVTITELGLRESLGAHNKVYWHYYPEDGCTVDETRVLANQAPIYVCSANGVAETGEIINIDGTGNRLASLCYGHEKVYIVVGRNKIAEDYDKALFRARNTACPLNAKRLGSKTPCAVNGDRCYDCESPGRICHAMLVLWRRPLGAKYEIVLVDEELGY